MGCHFYVCARILKNKNFSLFSEIIKKTMYVLRIPHCLKRIQFFFFLFFYTTH